MSDMTTTAGRLLEATAARKPKRPQVVADRLRDRILDHGLTPGDRLPAEWLLPEALGVSRGTFREAMKILETQGLVASKTGPGGGVFISRIEPTEAARFVRNLFLFDQPSIANIYALRKVLEPELAATAAQDLEPAAFAELQTTIRLYEDEPQSVEQEYQQRLAELEFHAVLAANSDNHLLGFVCGFLVRLLQDMAVCRDIYTKPNPELRETGLSYQVRLLRAIKAGDAARARTLMRDHMAEAEAYMLARAEIRHHRTTDTA